MLTPQLIREIKLEIREALKKIGEKYGVQIKLNPIHFFPIFGSAKIEICTTNNNGIVIDKYAYDLLTYGHLYNLRPDDLGDTFIDEGEEYQVIGLKRRSNYYPVVTRNTTTNNIVCFNLQYAIDRIDAKYS